MLTGGRRDRVYFAKFCDDGIRFGLGLEERNTGSQPPNHAPLHVVAIGDVIWNAPGKPDTRKLFHARLRRKQQFKTRREHADDRWRWYKRSGDWQRFADDRSIATEALLEIVVAQDCHRRQRWRRVSCWSIPIRHYGVRRAVGFLEVSATDDRTAHHLKEVRRHRSHAHSLRRTVQTGKSSAKRLHGSEVFEVVFGAVTQVEEIDVGKRKVLHVPFLQIAANQDQPLGISVRKFPQQHAVRDAEDGSACADRKGDGHYDGDSKDGALSQRAECVEEII